MTSNEAKVLEQPPHARVWAHCRVWVLKDRLQTCPSFLFAACLWPTSFPSVFSPLGHVLSPHILGISNEETPGAVRKSPQVTRFSIKQDGLIGDFPEPLNTYTDRPPHVHVPGLRVLRGFFFPFPLDNIYYIRLNIWGDTGNPVTTESESQPTP